MARRLSPADAEQLRKAVAAAYLRSQGSTQQQVADRLGISQSEVHRLLRSAERERFYIPNPQFIDSAAVKPILAEVRRTFLNDQPLRELVRKWAPGQVRCDVRIVDTTTLTDFGLAAVPVLNELVLSDRTIKHVGVSWGNTLAEVINKVRLVYPQPFRQGKELHCVPLCGDPVFAEKLNTYPQSASVLAATLAEDVNGAIDPDDPSLGVPMYISPKKFKGAIGKHVRQFIQSVPGWDDIFGPKGLLPKIDAVLTGVGGMPPEVKRCGYFLHERVKQGDLSWEELRRLCLGDLGGVLIARPDLSAADHKRVVQLNIGLTGMGFDEFKAMAARGQPGVIMFAAGDVKAPIIREIVRLGLVNYVIVDAPLAKTLLELEFLG